jgi:methyl-accepting chemotaxis protein
MKFWTIKSLNSFKIGTRVLSAFTLVTLISAMVILTQSYDFYTALLARDQAVKISFDAQQTADVQQVSLQRMNALLQTRFAQVFATISGNIADPSLQASGALTNSDILDRETDFKQTLQSYQQNFVLAVSPNMQTVRTIILSDDPSSTIGHTQQDALTAARSEWPAYKVLQDQALSLLNPSTNPLLVTNPQLAYGNAYLTLYKADQIFLNLELDWQNVVDSAQVIGEVVTNVGPSQTQPIVQTTLIALLLTLLVVITAGFVVNQTITLPLRQLAALTRRIATGDNNARAPIWGRDEIAQVATSMNTMLENIVKLIGESESQRAHLQLQVEQLSNQVSGIGRGNLSVHVNVTLPDLGILAYSFNFMIDAFSLLILQVKAVAFEIVSSTVQTSQSMNHLVTSAGQQINQIQEASREVERMALTSQGVANRAAEVSTVAINARRAAKDGKDTISTIIDGMSQINGKVNEAIQKVQRLQGYSSAIDEISDVMAALAQRTQRLSLNAATQVSMAGATNTGFAPIVQDIRNLAEQTKKETERIGGVARAVITEIKEVHQVTLTTSSEIGSLTKLVGQAGQSLEATFVAVQHQTDEIQEMARVAQGQVQSSQKVVGMMQGLSLSTRQSSTVIQAIGTQIQKQGLLLSKLHASVERFKVRDVRKQDSSGESYIVNLGKLQ